MTLALTLALTLAPISTLMQAAYQSPTYYLLLTTYYLLLTTYYLLLTQAAYQSLLSATASGGGGGGGAPPTASGGGAAGGAAAGGERGGGAGGERGSPGRQARGGGGGGGGGTGTGVGREELSVVVEKMERVISNLQKENAELRKRAVSNVKYVELTKEVRELRAASHTYIHTCMHTCIHTYVHTYIRTYAHRCASCERPSRRSVPPRPT